MKEAGMLFTSPMVRAILEGRKTQTRRVINRAYPYGQPGDRIYVRETFSQHPEWGQLAFRADGEEFEDADGWLWEPKWIPSIHMPKDIARIWLEITGVRVERLQDISEADALAEGISGYPFRPDDGWPICTGYTHLPDDGACGLWPTAKEAFSKLWTSTGGDWDANPWVWAIDFKVLSTTGRPA